MRRGIASAKLATFAGLWPGIARAEATGGYNFGGFIAAALAVVLGFIVALVVIARVLRRSGQSWGSVVLVLLGLCFLAFVVLAVLSGGL